MARITYAIIVHHFSPNSPQLAEHSIAAIYTTKDQAQASAEGFADGEQVATIVECAMSESQINRLTPYLKLGTGW